MSDWRNAVAGLICLLVSGSTQSPSTLLQSPSVAAHIQDAIDGRGSESGVVTPSDRPDLRALYGRSDAPLWVDAAGRPTANARDALSVLSHAPDDGLDPADYLQDVWQRLAQRIATAAPPTQEVALFDVAISTGMLRFLHDVHMGRVDPRTIGFDLAAPHDRHDFPALLRAAVANGRVVAAAAELRPASSQYAFLREMLARYRTLAEGPPFIVPSTPVKAIHPGEPYAAAASLGRELAAFGDVPAFAAVPSAALRYEGPLVEGVIRFQKRHGLAGDGVIGADTLAALRVAPAWRVRQIELSLERLRWLPHFGDERLIALNIPMFRLWAWDISPLSAMPDLAMDVIVGRAVNTQTPVFAEEMREVVFRPYWNVPPSILRHEVLPKIERDPDYMRREQLEIVRGAADDAPAVAAGPDAMAALHRGVLRVRQRPGPNNALGLIKFVFPNEHDVYMHGTPAQGLFARSRRDFSHGCVRVRDPVALAAWVLQDQPEWTRDRIVAATGGSETIHVKLTRPIHVILFYTTAAVMPEDGTIHFAQDIYRHDDRLDRALARRGGR